MFAGVAIGVSHLVFSTQAGANYGLSVAWLIFGFVGDMFTAAAAVALVMAGLLISIFDLPLTGPQVAIGLMVVSALILVNGQYTRTERIVKFLVLAFSVFIVVATIASLPQIGAGERAVFAGLEPSRALVAFAIGFLYTNFF
jgi:Mn2+/Fe2+ NRAMP family transporter